jgi:hypothetical protein
MAIAREIIAAEQTRAAFRAEPESEGALVILLIIQSAHFPFDAVRDACL